jgi:hypothetical protein
LFKSELKIINNRVKTYRKIKLSRKCLTQKQMEKHLPEMGKEKHLLLREEGGGQEQWDSNPEIWQRK